MHSFVLCVWVGCPILHVNEYEQYHYRIELLSVAVDMSVMFGRSILKNAGACH